MKTTIHRRGVLAALAAGVGACAASPASAADWRGYVLTTEIDLTSKDAPAVLWIPLVETESAYQVASPCRFRATGQGRIVRDARYGAAMLRVVWQVSGGERTVRLRQSVRTRDRQAPDGGLTAQEVAFWTAATPSLPTDGIVRQTALGVVAQHAEPRARARALYDWVVDNTFRDAAVRGCGVGGVEAMLRTGYLGGKCADINSLMTALCRAAGLPARDAYGVRLGPSKRVPCLGTAGPDVTHAQHCRTEVWLPGEGWFPLDPADVRKVVLETHAPVDSPFVKAQRERLFGQWEMNWAAYNHATDVQLPGAPASPQEHFLMYPLAITPSGEVDQLDPATFRYKITSTEA
jgi:hypothetical protein